jgi:spore germination cell wall hydrolase CwlJ-like protein
MEYNKLLLAICMWREARGEGLHGMRAVGCVIRNRVKEWNQSWFKVITGKNQFTSMSVPEDAQLIVWGNPHEAEFQAVLELADAIYENREKDVTNGSLYYYNPKTASSAWFVKNIVEKPNEHPRKALIGNHEFFA